VANLKAIFRLISAELKFARRKRDWCN